jgi:dephospho-CoA kinase
LKQLLQIGITGGIGSGKSLVCRIFACLGVPVYDADSRAKALMTTDQILISQIKKEFGDLSYDEAGNLNRNYLASRVFNHAEELQRLNALVHPRVAVDYTSWYNSQRAFAPYVIKEAALLYEAGSHKQLDKIIVVFASEETRIARVIKRDSHRTADQIRDIISRQWPDEEKVKRADFIVNNDGTSLVIPQVVRLHQQFINA